MGVNKAELKIVGTNSLPQEASTETVKLDIWKINPFGSFTATAPAQLPVGPDGKFVFGTNVVANSENGLTQSPALTPTTNGIKTVNDFICKQFAGYMSQVQNWDKSVDPNAAATIRNNWPKLADIDMALASNPRLLYLAQQANQDYV